MGGEAQFDTAAFMVAWFVFIIILGWLIHYFFHRG